ncbi:MAG: PadR family transcriptional regulator [Lachnospiraceae bacterium]|nr:PadR family transcriptional regulator [Lachnospiraceae bacterium]
MDTIILGLLMMKGSTIYELRQTIKTLLFSICSDSMGSIQASLKKLLENGYITFEERVEHGINKKIYFIQKEGKAYFLKKLATPMKNNRKNMELAKFFFMGFAEEEQMGLLDGYIAELHANLMELERLSEQLEPRYSFEESFHQELQTMGGDAIYLTKKGRDHIASFQYATLDLGMDALRFEIEWFQKFKSKIYKGVYLR